MRLGAAGMLGAGRSEDVRRLRAMGLTAASWHLPDFDVAADRRRSVELAAALRGEDVLLAQLLPPAYPSLVDPDPAVSKAGVAALVSLFPVVHALGARNLYVRPGSLNPHGPWTPHPQNRSPAARERLVQALRALCSEAEAAGVVLAVEAHVLSPLHSVTAAREVMDAVASPALRFNADPVNLVGDLPTAFDPAPLLAELFRVLGDRIVTAHVKDVRVSERLVLLIEECPPGEGTLPLGEFLRLLSAACPEAPVLVEHLSPEQVPAACAAVRAAAAAAGVPLE